jgi:hypothetical protein
MGIPVTSMPSEVIEVRTTRPPATVAENLRTS